jgi:hypothetical protein
MIMLRLLLIGATPVVILGGLHMLNVLHGVPIKAAHAAHAAQSSEPPVRPAINPAKPKAVDDDDQGVIMDEVRPFG